VQIRKLRFSNPALRIAKRWQTLNRINIMKLIFSLLLIITLSNSSIAQPDIDWQKCLGGTTNEFGRSIQQTTDGGYIIAGGSTSNNGDVTGNHGGEDIWIVKLNSLGNITWQKSLGGSGYDFAYWIQQTADGGYIIAGQTHSNDGDVTGNNGGRDVWIVKLSSVGAITWQKTLGGTSTDDAPFIQQTTDGGYIIAGHTFSTDGDVTSNHGGSDVWVVKLDSLGNITWQKSLGGLNNDKGQSILQTADGGYVVAGYSQSNDGDVTGNHGNNDMWIVKLDSLGNIIWQKSLGGTSVDAAFSMQQTTDGGYVVAGYSQSNNGDATGNHGDFDMWIIKLDSLGSIMWQKSLGGTDYDRASFIQQTLDGGYVISGYSQSNDGDVTVNHGDYDMWIVKLDSLGTIMWQKSLGGTNYDYNTSIQQTTDLGYIIIGYTWSNNGDVSGNHGNYDMWVIKLTNCQINTVDTRSECDSLVWIDGLTYTSNNNTSTHNIVGSFGCDSLVTLDLTINSTFSSIQTQFICQGDSLLIYGVYQNTGGTYYDSLQTMNGCDSILSTTLLVNSLPNVNLASFNPDTLCNNASVVVLPNANPIGGNYSGNGVIGSNFNPSTAGIGTHEIIYTYTDGNSCINSDTTIVTVDVCTGIDNISTDFGIIIYPNPSIGQFTIEKPSDLNKEVQVKLLDATSKLILEKVIPIGKQKVEMDIRNYSKGIYYLHLIVNDEHFVKQILKN
jgi:hypothetical protein